METCTGQLPEPSQLTKQIDLMGIPKLKELARKCTLLKPADRPSMEQIILVLKGISKKDTWIAK